MEEIVHLTGINSGDHESWCLDVDEETFTQVTGVPPDKEEFGNGSYFYDGYYRLYPQDIFDYIKDRPVKFTFMPKPRSIYDD